MIKEAIDRILELGPPNVNEYLGKVFSDKVLHEVEPERKTPAPIVTHTLTGMVDYLNENKDKLDSDDLMLLVKSFQTVSLIEKLDDYKKRHCFVISQFNTDLFGFCFGNYYPAEDFIISLFANFEGTEDRDELIKIASNLTSTSEVRNVDTGINQEVTVKSGVALKEERKVKNPVVLTPKRSFSEIDLPFSKFVFRIKRDEGRPARCAVFEADGAQWELEAIKAIKEYLSAEITDIPVIG